MTDVAIVGMGRWGRVLVDSVQGRSDRVRFTAGVTRTPAAAADYAARKGIAMRDRLEDLLSDRSIAGIVLATPHSRHADQIVACAAAGKPVFVEKPITLTLADGRRALDAVARAKTLFAAGFNRRFNPAIQDLKQLIAAGALGRILHAEANISGNTAGGYTAGMWRADPSESPAGGMAGMGIHMIDAFINLLGPIAAVQAQAIRRVLTSELDDTTSMLLRFGNGATGTLATLAATPRYARIAVFGERCIAEWRGAFELELRPAEGASQVRTYPAVDIERAELEAFADAIEGRAAYPVPVADVLNGIAAFEAVTTTARGGGWQEIA